MYHGLSALMTRALRMDARMLRGHLFRLAFVGMVYLSLLFAQLSSLSFGAPGLRFFTSLAWLNVCFICLAGVSFFATAITEEKEEDTLGLLRMAGLNPLGILLGKSTSRLLQAALLLIVQFPFTLLAVTLGGVLMVQVVAVYVSLLAFIVLLANVALVCSVLCQKGGNAAGLTALWLVLYVATPWLASAWLGWLVPAGTVVAGGDTLLVSCLKLVQDTSVFDRISVILATGFDESIFSTQVISNTLGGIAAFFVAWSLFNTFAKNATPTAQTRGMLGMSKSRQRRQLLAPGRVWSRPLAWKDYYFISGGTSLGLIKLFAYGALYGMVLLFNSPYMTYSASIDYKAVTGIWLTLAGMVTALDLALMSSRLFHDEIKGQTMSALLMLPRSIAHIGYSKLAGCLLGLWPAALALFIGLLLLPDAPEMLVTIVAEPGFWAVVMLLLIFDHIVALLSLFVKWGALPLAVVLMIVSFNCCPVLLIPLMLLDNRGDSGAALASIITLWILTGVICFVLQVMVGARLQEIGSK